VRYEEAEAHARAVMGILRKVIGEGDMEKVRRQFSGRVRSPLYRCGVDWGRRQGGMAKPSEKEIAVALLERHVHTFAGELGIPIEKNTPSPLFMLLYASLLFSTRISAKIAVQATGALADRGWTTPEKMANPRGSSVPRR
jgi:hypothetical protein